MSSPDVVFEQLLGVFLMILILLLIVNIMLHIVLSREKH